MEVSAVWEEREIEVRLGDICENENLGDEKCQQGLKGVRAKKWWRSMRFARNTRAPGPALPSCQEGMALTGAQKARLREVVGVQNSPLRESSGILK